MPASVHNQTIHLFGFAVDVEYSYTPGRPATGPTYSCGGEPAEPAEIEINKLSIGLPNQGMVVANADDLSEVEYNQIYDKLMENHDSDSGYEYDKHARED